MEFNGNSMRAHNRQPPLHRFRYSHPYLVPRSALDLIQQVDQIGKEEENYLNAYSKLLLNAVASGWCHSNGSGGPFTTEGAPPPSHAPLNEGSGTTRIRPSDQAPACPPQATYQPLAPLPALSMPPTSATDQASQTGYFTQSSVGHDEVLNTISSSVPANYALTWEMLREQRRVADAQIALARAKEDYLKAQAEAVRFGLAPIHPTGAFLPLMTRAEARTGQAPYYGGPGPGGGTCGAGVLPLPSMPPMPPVSMPPVSMPPVSMPSFPKHPM